MNKTNIEWVKNPDGSPGWSWNPLTGCLNHKDGFCNGGGFPCYAYRLANGRLKQRYLANDNITRTPYQTRRFGLKFLEYKADPFYPRFWVSRAGEPYHNKDCRGIFVCDMGELFGDWIPQSWQESVFTTIRDNPQHRFYLLTKQPQNLTKFSPFPQNCYVGVTVTNNAAMTLALTNLRHIQATVKFISFEPLLGSIGMNDHMSMKGIVDWVIIGAQTKPYKPPQIEWVREIVEAADKAGVAVFLKNNLETLFESANSPDDHFEWAVKEWVKCAYPILRQEMPLV